MYVGARFCEATISVAFGSWVMKPGNRVGNPIGFITMFAWWDAEMDWVYDLYSTFDCKVAIYYLSTDIGRLKLEYC